MLRLKVMTTDRKGMKVKVIKNGSTGRQSMSDDGRGQKIEIEMEMECRCQGQRGTRKYEM